MWIACAGHSRTRLATQHCCKIANSTLSSPFALRPPLSGLPPGPHDRRILIPIQLLIRLLHWRLRVWSNACSTASAESRKQPVSQVLPDGPLPLQAYPIANSLETLEAVVSCAAGHCDTSSSPLLFRRRRSFACRSTIAGFFAPYHTSSPHTLRPWLQDRRSAETTGTLAITQW